MVTRASRVPGTSDGRVGLTPTLPSPARGGGLGRGLHLRTLGHACAVLYRNGEDPLLATDPWLLGSVYWRSWWLQHYPSADEIDWLAKSACIYITHEHPDHFHMPSIRRLGPGPAYIFPRLAECGYLDHMAHQGYRAEAVAPLQWRAIADGVSILSIPMWNDDSLLLIDTPAALIMNLNDAKPLPPVLRAIRRMADHIAKPRVLLCSYSPASLVNSFVDDSGIVSLKPPRHYVNYVCRLCDRISAECYMPFASQAIFNRADSRWANDHRTTWDHLRQYWDSTARLLPSYTTLDLQNLRHQAIPRDQYRPMAPAKLALLTNQRSAAEEATEISVEDVAGLEHKLNAFRWLLSLIFPRGFAFQLGERRLKYDPPRGRLRDVDAVGGRCGDFIVTVPKLTIKEAIRHDHVSDLGITMFVRIRLLRRLDPKKIYALFVLFQFDDYGHLRSVRSFLRWLGWGFRYTFALRLPAPPV